MSGEFPVHIYGSKSKVPNTDLDPDYVHPEMRKQLHDENKGGINWTKLIIAVIGVLTYLIIIAIVGIILLIIVASAVTTVMYMIKALFVYFWTIAGLA